MTTKLLCCLNVSHAVDSISNVNEATHEFTSSTTWLSLLNLSTYPWHNCSFCPEGKLKNRKSCLLLWLKEKKKNSHHMNVVSFLTLSKIFRNLLTTFIGINLLGVKLPLDFSILCGTDQVLFWPLLAENNQYFWMTPFEMHHGRIITAFWSFWL